MATKPDTEFLPDNTKLSNFNYLTTNYFQIAISRAPTVSFFAQEVTCPSISMVEAIQPTAVSTAIPIPGNSYTFMPLNVKFTLDEELKAWQEIYHWITTIANYKSTANTVAYHDRFSDITLKITNSAYKGKFEIVFRNAFPISLSEIPFSVTAADNVPLTATATFKYAYYDFRVLTSS
jgi:hypothetical protein